ncbi:MAG: hypothetical protein M1825_000329 [Sarcosagium campestre]|nr:MAG: hypothetical protein M1825_000329 [Sarcosagium campestre]
MGRQAYITRLALGRSAYGPPDAAQDDSLAQPSTSTPTPVSTSDSNAQSQSQSQSHETPKAQSRGDATKSESGQYVQQYDSRGHPTYPASRAQARAQIHAQNDVLATVGVCVGVKNLNRQADPPPRRKSERENIELVMSENETGLIMSGIDVGLLFLTTWWIVGFKNRLQLYPMLSDLSLFETIRLQYRTFGLWSLLLAGMPSQLLFMLLNGGKDFLLTSFIHRAYTLWAYNDPQRKSRLRKKQATAVLDTALRSLFFVGMVPLQLFSMLQVLNLLPAYPIFPPLASMLPFSSTSPLQLPVLPAKVSVQSLTKFGITLITSPPAIVAATCYSKDYVLNASYRIIQSVLPKPDNPDPFSIKGALEDSLDGTTIPGIHSVNVWPAQQPRAANRPAGLLERAGSVVNQLLNAIGLAPGASGAREDLARVEIPRGYVVGPSEAEPTWRQAAMARDPSDPPPSDEATDHADVDLGEDVEVDTEQDTEHDTEHDLDVEGGPEAEADAENEGDIGVDAEGTRTPLEEVGSSAGEESDDDGRINSVRVANHRGENPDSITMEVEIAPGAPTLVDVDDGNDDGHEAEHEHEQSGGHETYAQDRDAYRQGQRRVRRDGPVRRVTVLSSHPAEAIASHLSLHLAQWLLLPMEALMVRSVAASFIASGPTTATVGLTRSIYMPLQGRATHPWRLGGSILGAKYLTNLAYIAGMDLAISFGLVELGYLGVMLMGRRVFDWGRL